MSRKSRTTLYLRVKLPVPPGSNAQEVMQYVRTAIQGWKGGGDPQDPIFSLQTEEMTVSLEKKETVYF